MEELKNENNIILENGSCILHDIVQLTEKGIKKNQILFNLYNIFNILTFSEIIKISIFFFY